MKALAWSVPLAIAFSALCYAVALYNIEEAKQNSFMMQACVKAGGSWQTSWGRPQCLGPKS